MCFERLTYPQVLWVPPLEEMVPPQFWLVMSPPGPLLFVTLPLPPCVNVKSSLHSLACTAFRWYPQYCVTLVCLTVRAFRRCPGNCSILLQAASQELSTIDHFQSVQVFPGYMGSASAWRITYDLIHCSSSRHEAGVEGEPTWLLLVMVWPGPPELLLVMSSILLPPPPLLSAIGRISVRQPVCNAVSLSP